MKVRDQLLCLVRIQDLALGSRAAHEVAEGAPRRLQEIEDRFRERNAEYVEVRERHDALTADQRKRASELTVLEEQRKKYMDDLMQVKNQREYAAILREIDLVKSQIAIHEEAILKDMEEIESVQGELESRESHIQEERKRVTEERMHVEAEAEEARQKIALLEEERRRVQAGIPVGLVATVRRLEDGRQGVFLSKAEDGVCQCCYVRMRPQVFQEIKLAAKVHACSNCRRLLYHGPSLVPAPEASEMDRDGGASAQSHGNVEAVKGGAV